jgi:hypothetical protein
MSKNDGGSAFPQPWHPDMGWQPIPEGMSLRDYFAAQALPLAWEIEQAAPTGPYSERMEPTYAGAATRAYFIADAMLKAREAKP